MGKSKFYRFERFEQVIYPEILKLMPTCNITIDKEGRLAKFYRHEYGKASGLLAVFFPIGNLVQLPENKWIREDGIGYLMKLIFGYEMPQFSSLLYIDGVPPVKTAKIEPKVKDVTKQADKLVVVGHKYADVNLKHKKTLAVVKMIKCLNDAGIPFIPEFPVVIKQSSRFDSNPKLYLLDFYIPPPFNLIIEVDGGYHETAQMKEYDKVRDASVAAKGLGQTIRFTNEEVLLESFSLIKVLKTNHKFKHAILRARTQRALQDF